MNFKEPVQIFNALCLPSCFLTLLLKVVRCTFIEVQFARTFE